VGVLNFLRLVKKELMILNQTSIALLNFENFLITACALTSRSNVKRDRYHICLNGRLIFPPL
jgi:hypothetical protein